MVCVQFNTGEFLGICRDLRRRPKSDKVFFVSQVSMETLILILKTYVTAGLRGELAATKTFSHSKRFILTSVKCGSAGVRIHENFIPATSWNIKTCRRFHPSRCQAYADQDVNQGTKLHEKLAEKNYDSIDVDLVENGTVGVIYLDRQKALNALSEALMNEVVDACQTFESIEEVSEKWYSVDQENGILRPQALLS